MYRSIVVPLDGTAFGEQALPLALNLARQYQARLHLMHAHTATKADLSSRKQEQLYLNTLISEVKRTWDGPIDGTVIGEPIVSALCAYAASVQAELIVMSTHARTGFLRLWLGCVADEVVRSTPIPVLLVRAYDTAPKVAIKPAMQHILVPLDGSHLAELILPHAVALGGSLQADYTLLQVIEPPPIESVGSSDQSPEGLRDAAHNYLESVAEQMRREGMHVQTDVIIADRTADALLGYTRAKEFDLTTIATHGRSGMGRVLIGSVADAIVRNGTTPVLLHCPR